MPGAITVSHFLAREEPLVVSRGVPTNSRWRISICRYDLLSFLHRASRLVLLLAKMRSDCFASLSSLILLRCIGFTKLCKTGMAMRSSLM